MRCCRAMPARRAERQTPGLGEDAPRRCRRAVTRRSTPHIADAEKTLPRRSVAATRVYRASRRRRTALDTSAFAHEELYASLPPIFIREIHRQPPGSDAPPPFIARDAHALPRFSARLMPLFFACRQQRRRRPRHCPTRPSADIAAHALPPDHRRAPSFAQR